MTSGDPALQGGRRAGLGWLAGVLGALGASAASASDWVVTVGGGVNVFPPYEGAGHEIVRPVPSFNIRRSDIPYRFTPTDGGSTIAVVNLRHFIFGPVVRFRHARSDTGQLTGPEPIGWAAEPGAFAEIWPTDWLRLRGEERYGLGGYYGLVGDAAIDLIYTGRRWDASFGPRVGWGGANYMDTYFGVTPAEAIRSPVIDRPYEPGGGQRYLGAAAAVAYHLTPSLWTTLAMSYHRLAPDAAHSPVVEAAGSANDYAGGVTFTYRFGMHLGRRPAPAP